MVSAPFSANFMLPVPDASGARGRDLLGQVGRGEDHLGQRHAVVGEERDLEPVADGGSLLTTSPTALISRMISLAMQ